MFRRWLTYGRWLAGLALLVAALAAVPAAMAQEAFVIRADRLDAGRFEDGAYLRENLSAAAQYIRVTCALEEDGQARLKVVRADTGSVVLDKNYGSVSGMFDSGDIYLSFSGSDTIPYTITLMAGEQVYVFPFYRRLMVLENNTACTFGVRIRELDRRLTDAWTMATPLDLEEVAALPGGVKRLPVCASDMYVIGTVTVRVREGMLRVSMQLDEGVDFDIAEQRMFLLTSPAEWTSVNPRQLSEREYEIGMDIPLDSRLPDVRYAVLFLPIRLTYDPNGLTRFEYDRNDPELIRQMEIWQEMLEMDKAASVG